MLLQDGVPARRYRLVQRPLEETTCRLQNSQALMVVVIDKRPSLKRRHLTKVVRVEGLYTDQTPLEERCFNNVDGTIVRRRTPSRAPVNGKYHQERGNGVVASVADSIE
jgi:hypothetical protein